MSNLLEKIGSRIRAHRKRLQLSQENLAHLVDISDKYLGEIERGQVNPSIGKLVGIARALHIHPAELLDEEPDDSESFSRACYLLSTLPDRDFAIILDMLETFHRHSSK